MTDTQKAAMEQALEALKKSHPYSNSDRDLDKHSEAIHALRAALAEQPAEPLDGKLVMGLAVIRELTGTQKTDNIEATIEAVRKAVAPQPRRRLTDEEIYECERIAAIRHHRHKNSIRGQQITAADDPQWHFARAIERAHGIGEQE